MGCGCQCVQRASPPVSLYLSLPPRLTLHLALLTGTPKGILLELRLDPTSPPLRSFLSLWINQKDQVGQRKGIPG